MRRTASEIGLQGRRAPRQLRLITVVVALTCLVLLLFPVLGKASSGSATEAVDFSFSTDPTHPILSILHFGSSTGQKVTWVLYGDGRLELESVDRSGRVLEHLEASLSFIEARELVGIAVEHGLADTDTEQLTGSLKQKTGGGSLRVGEDAADMILEIDLTTYRGGGVELGPRKRQLRLHAPGALHAMFPDVRELRGIVELTRRIEGIAARAREVQSPRREATGGR